MSDAKVDVAGGGNGILRVDFGRAGRRLERDWVGRYLRDLRKIEALLSLTRRNIRGKTCRFNKFISRQD